MTPYNGNIEILDRYMRIAFDLKFEEADETCLFGNFESLDEADEQYKKILEKRPSFDAKQGFETLWNKIRERF